MNTSSNIPQYPLESGPIQFMGSHEVMSGEEVHMRWWWRIRSAMRIPTFDSRVSAMITLAGFVAGVTALALPAMGFIAWPLAFLGATTALLFFVDILVREFMMRKLPAVHHSLKPGDFLLAPKSLRDTSYQFVAPNASSEAQLYPYVDISHGCDPIGGANPEVTRERRLDLYRRWFQLCPQGFLHLEKKELMHWRPIAVAIALPITRTALERIRSFKPDRQKKVIDLEGADFAPSLGTNADCLLIDTWIVDGPYRGTGHGKTDDEGGFANSLVLRLIAHFLELAVAGQESSVSR